MKDVYDKALKEITLLTTKVSNKNAESLKNDTKNTKNCSNILPRRKPGSCKNQPTNPQCK